MPYCRACGFENPSSHNFCKKCGVQLSNLPAVAPAKKKTRIWLIFVVLIAVYLVFKFVSLIGEPGGSSSTVTVSPGPADSKGGAVPPGVTNDAELLIARCGRPSSDDTTANDNPRPPIPTRIIEYRRQRLRFLFIPGKDTNLGDPPPYKWSLFGTTDMTAKDPAKARVVMPSEAVARMPCWSVE
jgi:hypothetical protein